MDLKYAIILPDGAADEPVDKLDGKTPIEAARTPNIDWIATHGRQGLVVTVPEAFAPGSDIATLSLLGYDPHAHYSGRAPLEAAAQNLAVIPGELIFRCNFVSLLDGLMEDFTAGHITSAEARELISYLNEHIGERRCTFHAGVSYRNLLVVRDADDLDPRCTPPHDIPGRPVVNHLPEGKGSEWTIGLMQRAHDLLASHGINQVRRDLGENPATDIWLWGQGRPRNLPAFCDQFGVRAACIAAVDLIRGIARTTGMELLDVPGATGYLDTDYAAKGRAAVDALDGFDVVIVHIEAPDEAGHQGDVAGKMLALERIDTHIVGPVLEKLQTFPAWRILVAPDHPTPVGKRVHTRTPPPFCMAGHRVSAIVQQPFSEANAAEAGLRVDRGCELMEFFLKGD